MQVGNKTIEKEVSREMLGTAQGAIAEVVLPEEGMVREGVGEELGVRWRGSVIRRSRGKARSGRGGRAGCTGVHVHSVAIMSGR